MRSSYSAPRRRIHWWDRLDYWGGMPIRLAGQFARNCHDIVRVIDLLKFRRLGAGLVSLDHPWVTGINPATGDYIWYDNVIYRSPRTNASTAYPKDAEVLVSVGKFMAS